MRVDLDDRLNKEYPEPPECQINERNCSFSVEALCHQCGAKMCADCMTGVRHQPRPSKFTYQVAEGTERFEYHCPRCLNEHTLSRRNLAISGGGVVLGALLSVVGGVDTIPLTVAGIVLLVIGLYVLRIEYRLKARTNPNYGLSDMW